MTDEERYTWRTDEDGERINCSVCDAPVPTRHFERPFHTEATLELCFLCANNYTGGNRAECFLQNSAINTLMLRMGLFDRAEAVPQPVVANTDQHLRDAAGLLRRFKNAALAMYGEPADGDPGTIGNSELGKTTEDAVALLARLETAGLLEPERELLLRVSIGCVNGDGMELQTAEGKERALAWLVQQDHEGSSVSVWLTDDEGNDLVGYSGSDKVYAFLRDEPVVPSSVMN